ncbi:hypothetical protein RJT34_03698 [Clitoria ternatea]|uniref:Uncharacterized protein n=1 Tax=Clitoria ternatea TaxID=43366 RepID=A0AAN9KKN6_CLITE
MAYSASKILSTILFLVFVSQGYSQCSLKDISVSQQQTGAKVQGKPEWAVTITNKCSCVQTSLVLNCDGFKTSEPVDRSILSLMGPYCIVKAGDSITKDPITFKYAWDVSFPFNPVSSRIHCP